MASARSSRMIGAWATLGWVMLLGTLIAVPATIIAGAGADLTPTAIQLLVISGIANIVGLLLAYTAFRGGQVAVIAPIISTEGAMGAVISILFGEQIGIAAAIVLTAIAIGIVLASSGGSEEAIALEPNGRHVEPTRREETRPPINRATLFAVGAVVFFGVNLYVS